MKLSYFSRNDFITSQWSGGSTTEMYISPEDASLSKRNFDLRISTAKVDVKESIFTPLPGVNRTLMVLEGETILDHLGHHNIHLTPFKSDTFSGDWTTSAKGIVTNFNVMTTGDTQSELSGLTLVGRSQINIEPNWTALFIYVVEGDLKLTLGQENVNLVNGSLLVIDNIKQYDFPIHSSQYCKLAIVKVKQLSK